MLLDFFWHTRGSVRIASSASSALVMEYVADFLRLKDKSVSCERDDYATFEDLLWGLPRRFSPLSAYERGRFGIADTSHGRELRYEFRCLHVFLASLFMGALAATGLSHHYGVGKGIAGGVIFFIAVYLGVILQGLIYLPFAMQNVVRSA